MQTIHDLVTWRPQERNKSNTHVGANARKRGRRRIKRREANELREIIQEEMSYLEDQVEHERALARYMHELPGITDDFGLSARDLRDPQFLNDLHDSSGPDVYDDLLESYPEEIYDDLAHILVD